MRAIEVMPVFTDVYLPFEGQRSRGGSGGSFPYKTKVVGASPPQTIE